MQRSVQAASIEDLQELTSAPRSFAGHAHAPSSKGGEREALLLRTSPDSIRKPCDIRRINLRSNEKDMA